MKKALSILLAVVMVLGMSAVAFAATQEAEIADLNAVVHRGLETAAQEIDSGSLVDADGNQNQSRKAQKHQNNHRNFHETDLAPFEIITITLNFIAFREFFNLF